MKRLLIIALAILLILAGTVSAGRIACPHPTPDPTPTPTITPTISPTVMPTAVPTIVPTPTPTKTPDPDQPVASVLPYDLTPIEFKYKVSNLKGSAVWTVWGFTSSKMIYSTEKAAVSIQGWQYVRMVVPVKYAGSLIYFKACDNPGGVTHCSAILSFKLPVPDSVLPYHCHTYSDVCTGEE